MSIKIIAPSKPASARDAEVCPWLIESTAVHNVTTRQPKGSRGPGRDVE